MSNAVAKTLKVFDIFYCFDILIIVIIQKVIVNSSPKYNHLYHICTLLPVIDYNSEEGFTKSNVDSKDRSKES